MWFDFMSFTGYEHTSGQMDIQIMKDKIAEFKSIIISGNEN